MADSGSGIVQPSIQLADQPPVSEGTVASAGTASLASRMDHKHERLSSATRATLDSNGLATVTYTRSFAAPPCVSLTGINPSGAQIALEQVDDIVTGGLYTGCHIRGSRAQNLPTLAPVTGILTAVIVGINAIASALSGFAPFSASSAAGTVVNVLVVQASS